MHDQLSFTEVPKKYINANKKKTKKNRSKKLVNKKEMKPYVVIIPKKKSFQTLL